MKVVIAVSLEKMFKKIGPWLCFSSSLYELVFLLSGPGETQVHGTVRLVAEVISLLKGNSLVSLAGYNCYQAQEPDD